jgi:hypothetical protein
MFVRLMLPLAALPVSFSGREERRMPMSAVEAIIDSLISDRLM